MSNLNSNPQSLPESDPEDISMQIITAGDMIVIGFEQPLSYIQLTPNAAIDMANAVLKAARQINRQLN